MKKRLLAILVLISIVIFPSYAETFNQPDAFDHILDSEKKVLESLFVIVSEIELMNTLILRKNEEISQMNAQIEDLEDKIEQQQMRYASQVQALGEILRHQQRQGLGSSLEILLNARNIKDFMRRMALLQDFSKNSKRLIEETSDLIAAIEKDSAVLSDQVAQKISEELALQEALLEKEMKKIDLETALEGLANERAYYEGYLKTLEKQWIELKPLFNETVKSFNEIIKTGGLSEEAVSLSIQLFNAKAIIHEDAFNKALKNDKRLTDLSFSFSREYVSLYFPTHQILLEGEMVLMTNQSIAYQVHAGYFYEFELSPSAIEDLFSAGALVFDLSEMMGKNTIRSIQLENRQIILDVFIRLF